MQNKKQELIDKFIELAAHEGVNEEALCDASRLVYGDKSGYILDFYNGLEEVISGIEQMFDANLLQDEEIQNTKSVTEKIRLAAKARINKDPKYLEFFVKLNDYYKTFKGKTLFWKNSWNTCDYIWRLAGDQSLDFNFYSKRLLLLSIYKKAYNTHFSERSDDRFRKTSESIDKGLDRVKNINKLKQKFNPENIPFVRLFIK